jgi:hypothetical protein
VPNRENVITQALPMSNKEELITLASSAVVVRSFEQFVFFLAFLVDC